MNIFLGTAQTFSKFFPSLKVNLLYADIKKDSREYIAEALQKTLFFFITILILTVVTFVFFKITQYGIAVLVAFVMALFFFISLILVPSISAGKRIRGLERNLLPALQSIFVQINSGIPLFEVLTNVSKANYGGVSREFSKAVNKMNAGKSQVDALEDMVVENPSVFFRRAIWQIINGMKSGADLSATIEQAISLLAEEKVLQIQSYGSRLSPLAMFYMLLGIIFPALSIIFVILFVAIANVPANTISIIFGVVFIFIVLFQVVFLGLINIRRPSLL